MIISKSKDYFRDGRDHVVYTKDENGHSNPTSSNKLIDIRNKIQYQEQNNPNTSQGDITPYRNSSQKIIHVHAKSLKEKKKISLYNRQNTILSTVTPRNKIEEESKANVQRVFSFKESSPKKARINYFMSPTKKK
jgi:hypothetical protein